MTKLYRLLLLLYPAGFRREYGEQMVAIFAERAAARGRFGRAALLLGDFPDVLSSALTVHWEMLGQDLRYTTRTLRRAPAFALTAILVTAIGVGANTAVFSVADFVLLRPLPYPEQESLVRLCEGPRRGPSGWGCMNELSPANYRDFREQTTSFAALGAFRRDAVNLVDGGEPQRVEMALVTTEVLPLLGVRPLFGELLAAGAADADARQVVLSYDLWQARFGGARDVLGRTLSLDGAAHTVVGVMPPAFNFPDRTARLWVPLLLREEDFEDRNDTYLQGIGRLAAGVTFEEARRDLGVVVERLAFAYPQTNEETGVSFFRWRDEFAPRYRLMLQALCGASLFILLLTCANLGNLLLARAATRERELSLRAALGAGRERLVRQMITESMLLAVAGGAAGVLVSLLAFPLLALLIPPTLPLASDPALNVRWLGLAALFTALTGLGFGVLPAVRAAGRAAFGTLRDGPGGGGGRRRRVRSALVTIEVAASVVLLVSSGLLIRAMLRVEAVDPGFRAEHVLTMRTVLPRPEYESALSRERFYQQVLAAVRGLPGVQSAAYTSGLPMVMMGGITGVVLPGQEVRSDGDYAVSRRYITPQFFTTLGISLLRGRDLVPADAEEQGRAAVVSQSFVQRYWPDEDPVGRTFLFQGQERTVIGVVGDIRVRGLERSSEPQMYLPSSHAPGGLTFHDPKDLVIRTSAREAVLLPAVRDIIRAADPDLAISDVRWLDEVVGEQTALRRAQVQVLAALAVVGLLLAGLGIYGLLAYTVAQQRQEIGVRLALGAEPGRIARTVMWNGLSLVLIGLIPGLLLAVLAGRSMSALLFGVPAGDGATLVVTVALCLVMAVAGALIPARRAVRVNPISVLRAE